MLQNAALYPRGEDIKGDGKIVEAKCGVYFTHGVPVNFNQTPYDFIVDLINAGKEELARDLFYANNDDLMRNDFAEFKRKIKLITADDCPEVEMRLTLREMRDKPYPPDRKAIYIEITAKK